jgi:hypothetical protein
MDIVNDQIADVGLYNYCTKTEQCLLDARYFVIDKLDLRQGNVGDSPMKEPLLADLYKALVGDNKNAEVPRHPGDAEYYKPEDTADCQAAEEESKTKAGRDCCRDNTKKWPEHAKHKALPHNYGMAAKDVVYGFVIVLVFEMFWRHDVVLCFSHKQIVPDSTMTHFDRSLPG